MVSVSEATRTKSKTKTTATTTTVNSFNPKIENIASELSSNYIRDVLYAVGDNTSTIILDYITAMKTELNYSPHYARNIISVLCKFSKFHKNKSFKDITRDDVIRYLDSLRKTEIEDPSHKWIGTYNLYRIYFLRFFKWYLAPNLEHKKRPKPAMVDNIPKLTRREKSIYKPSDLWTPQDDLLFLKYCPSKRDKCYHAISRDTSARPNEILKLKIRDVTFKNIGKSQYAEAVVNGKTGTRPIPLINSIPYLKDYLSNEHPQSGNPNAPLICGTNKGLGRHINPVRMSQIYAEYKKEIFPKLLDSPTIPPEDKRKLMELFKKPWNPYIRRHSALTEKSTILKEHVLRQHAGWSPGSNMHLRYVHYFGNESNESLLEAYGLVDKGVQIDQLKPKYCNNCEEPNRVDAKFCVKCKMILSFEGYNELMQEQEQHKSDMDELRANVNRIMEMIQQNPKLAHVKPEVLVKKK
jgi:integrase/recombinase XerD